MAALDFPNSPSLNEVFASNNRTWIWDGTVWSSSGVVGDPGPTGPAGVAGVAGPTGPTGPIVGNTDGGTATSVYGGISPLQGGNASSF